MSSWKVNFDIIGMSRDSSRSGDVIGIGYYDDFERMLNLTKEKYKAMILIDSECKEINQACPKRESCFRPSYPLEKL